MVRRADLLNKNKRGRLTPVVEEVIPEPVVVEDQPLDLSTLKLTELRALCIEQGLDAKGKKSELIAKLSNSGDGSNGEDSE